MRADLVVVGAGPGGLSAAAAGRARGWRTVVLEATGEVGGLWARVRPDMRCLSLRRYDRLPDGEGVEGAAERAVASEVLAAWRAFADRARLDVRFGQRVTALRRGEGWRLTAGDVYEAPRVVLATGSYERPWVPELPGRFDGPACHSSALSIADVERGERVVVVGFGNSAAEWVPRLLARGAEVTVSGQAGRPASIGRGLRGRLAWWVSGLPVRWAPGVLGCSGGVPVVDDDVHRAVAAGTVSQVGRAVGLTVAGVVTEAGEVPADRVVWATGYRRDLRWAGLGTGEPAQTEGLSTELPGVGFVGIDCMRTRRSGFLRGIPADARAVVARL